MPDTVTSRWIYPPNWDGSTYTTRHGNRRYVKLITNVSDGSGESDVVKIDMSNHKTVDGIAASKLVLDRVECILYGFTRVLLEFDVSTDETLIVLQDTCDLKFPGGISPDGTGGTGDVILTTAGAAAGNTYTITLHYRVK